MLVPTVLIGVALGTWVLSLLSPLSLKKTIGVAILAFVAIQLVVRGRERAFFGDPPRRSVTGAVGLVAGVAATVAHSGGVVLGPYLVALGLANASVVATANAVVAVSNVLKLVGYWRIGFLTGPILLASVLALPLLVLGTWLGYRLNRQLPRRWFELALIAVAIAGALRLLAAP